jgi:hypothetical protein
VDVFPNPTTGRIDISLNNFTDNIYKIEVFNNLGSLLQTIVKQKEIGLFQIDLSGYPAGIYWLRIKTKSQTYQSKIIKQ